MTWRKTETRRGGVKVNPHLDRAYRLLFGPTNKAGCVVCNEDEPELLGIHPNDSNENEWRILCDRCYGALTTPSRKGAMQTCFLNEKYNTTQEGVTL